MLPAGIAAEFLGDRTAVGILAVLLLSSPNVGYGKCLDALAELRMAQPLLTAIDKSLTITHN